MLSKEMKLKMNEAALVFIRLNDRLERLFLYSRQKLLECKREMGDNNKLSKDAVPIINLSLSRFPTRFENDHQITV